MTWHHYRRHAISCHRQYFIIWKYFFKCVSPPGALETNLTEVTWIFMLVKQTTERKIMVQISCMYTGLAGQVLKWSLPRTWDQRECGGDQWCMTSDWLPPEARVFSTTTRGLPRCFTLEWHAEWPWSPPEDAGVEPRQRVARGWEKQWRDTGHFKEIASLHIPLIEVPDCMHWCHYPYI